MNSNTVFSTNCFQHISMSLNKISVELSKKLQTPKVLRAGSYNLVVNVAYQILEALLKTEWSVFPSSEKIAKEKQKLPSPELELESSDADAKANKLVALCEVSSSIQFRTRS